MSQECAAVHALVNQQKRHNFPLDESEFPLDGIYILFQKDEPGHGQDRIVRVGTHTGDNQLYPRLKQHFINENKDRSIFRKNIGRALLNKNNDSFLRFWNLDLTTRKARDEHSSSIDFDYQKEIEKKVSRYIQKHFSMCAFEVQDKQEKLDIESKIISTVSLCNECKSSNNWLGRHSPKKKIIESGLWLVNELYKTPFNNTGIDYLSKLIKNPNH